MNAPVSIPTPPYHHTPLFPLARTRRRMQDRGPEAVKIEKVMGGHGRG
jgi:hypothetical protein